MTPEQWQAVERAVSRPYGGADLVVDGYQVALRVEPLKGLRSTIVVYVNGMWKGEWLANDCEERRRFFRPVRVCYMNNKDYQSWRKVFGKKDADKRRENLRGCYWLPDWPAFSRLKRHLVANNKSVELDADSETNAAWVKP